MNTYSKLKFKNSIFRDHIKITYKKYKKKQNNKKNSKFTLPPPPKIQKIIKDPMDFALKKYKITLKK
jgi:hypothetical protein